MAMYNVLGYIITTNNSESQAWIMDNRERDRGIEKDKSYAIQIVSVQCKREKPGSGKQASQKGGRRSVGNVSVGIVECFS
jgi:hypothetical protein